MTRALLIAGTHSGVGKTTVSLALMAALRRRGLGVQPFKVGPDFIDPGHHSEVCGRVSRNLDTWMLSEDTVRATFARASASADVAVMEGVMGLFDGRRPDDWRGSTASIARLLRVPVVLVVDAAAMSTSVAAVLRGFSDFEPDVAVVAVVCNRVAGQRHYDTLAAAIRRYTTVPPLGWLPRQSDWTIPERHLGLTTALDFPTTADRWEALADAFEATVHVNELLALAMPPPAFSPSAPEQERLPSHCRVAVARDSAFCFYYPENLELLEAAGAEVVFFSPLMDATLPEGTGVLYLGGGYPELKVDALAANESMRHSIRRFHDQGGTIYAECGGLMYVCRELVRADGRAFPMLDLLPARSVMMAKRAALGYVSLRTIEKTPLGPPGTTVRGHEYHYSRLEALGPLRYAGAIEPEDNQVRLDGIVSGNLWASYAHLHWSASPTVARHLLRTQATNV